jgi:DNA-binding winged helix-turn-helix (wHTH) protein
MSTVSFVLNARYKVEPNLNLVKDLEQGKEFRLEPRLMKLLCLLTQNKDELVARETIIKEIWDNYGNPDESLTQAISYLRKVLSDQQKKLIETVPKKGYVFRATVGESVPGSTIFSETRNLPKQKFRRQPVAIFLLGMAITVIVFFFLRSGKDQAIGNPDSTTTEIPFPGLSREEEANYLNTITTTDSLGTKYRLVMIGDRRPELYVNDSLQSDQEPYDGLIDRLAKELWKRQKEAEKK